MPNSLQLVITILLLLITFSSWIYAFVLLIKGLRNQLSRRSIAKNTFGVTFCGWLSMFIAYPVWLDDWKFDSWVFYVSVALVFSLLGALAFTASFLWQKRK